jgi:hypothetical protein
VPRSAIATAFATDPGLVEARPDERFDVLDAVFMFVDHEQP